MKSILGVSLLILLMPSAYEDRSSDCTRWQWPHYRVVEADGMTTMTGREDGGGLHSALQTGST